MEVSDKITWCIQQRERIGKKIKNLELARKIERP